MNKFHRFLSIVLCLALVLFCLSVPFRSSAAADAGFVSISLGGSFVSVSGAVAVAVLVLSGFGIVWGSIEEAVAEAKLWYNAVPKIVKDWLDKAGQEVVEGHTTVKIPETVIEGINSVDEAHQLSPASPYLDTSGFNLDTISPTDLFAQDVVGAIQQSGSATHSLLRTLYGLLNTEFTEIGDVISDQTSSLTGSLSNVVSRINVLNGNVVSLVRSFDLSLTDLATSIDTITSTLHKDIVNLNSVYSSFGNDMLSKLDTLNDSLEDLDTSSLSGDFLNLYNLIAQNDALTISALQNLPDQISDSLLSYFESQSLQLESISDKLGVESSYLLDLVGDMQLVRDEVSNGFADTLVALGQLDVTADIDLQPVIDQIFDSGDILNNSLNALYDVISAGFVDTLVALDQLDVSADIDLQPLIDEILSLSDIQEKSFGSIQEMSGTIVQNFDVSLEALSDRLSTEFASLKTSVINMKLALQNDIQILSSEVVSLKSNLVSELTDIKTAVQSIAGTTVANPPVHSSDLDELDKLEVPLYGAIGSGFDKGDEFFGFTLVSLDDELNAFLVAAKIFNEYADLTFFKKLIIASASIGFVCSLLGMGLDATGAFSSAYRRRESAAQAKSRERFERGLVVQ